MFHYIYKLNLSALVVLSVLIATGCGDAGRGLFESDGADGLAGDPLAQVSEHSSRTGGEESEWYGGRWPRLPHVAPSQHTLESGYYDSGFETSRGIVLRRGAAFDTEKAHGGARSIFLDRPGDAFALDGVPIEGGKWYVVSGYMLSSRVPKALVKIHLQINDDRGNFLYNVADYNISVSAVEAWEEFIAPVYVRDGIDAARLSISVRFVDWAEAEEGSASDVWLDDIRLVQASDSSKLFGFEPPKPRKPFLGKEVRIDELGNWELYKQGRWQPFFPMIIYPDNAIGTDWKKYREKGFNTVTQIGYPDAAKRASAAGMYWMWDITSYLFSEGQGSGVNAATGDTARFEALYKRFLEETGFEGMIAYYWDNEDLDEWQSVQDITDKIRQLDQETFSSRAAPIYMNSKHIAANSLFMNESHDFIDLQGGYINPLISANGETNPEWPMYLASDKMVGIRSPQGIGIVNVPQERAYLEPLIFAGIARGMRGFAFWRDGFNNGYHIESRPWWEGFRKTADKINKMLPLVRQPHWTSWDLEVSIPEKEDTLIVGKRDFEGKRHLILASYSDQVQKVTFSTDMVVMRVRDFFTGAVIAQPQNESFDYLLPAHGTAVLVLE